MYKISQQELLSEGFWSKFGKLAKQGIETVKQVSSVVAPEIYDPISKSVNKLQDMGAAIKEAGKPIELKIKRWVEEQGRFPISEPKKLTSYPDGKTHYSIRIAEKGVSSVDNSVVGGRIYKNPSAVVSYNRRDKQFGWVNKPRSDSYVSEFRSDGRKYHKYHDQNADGVNEPIDTIQPAGTPRPRPSGRPPAPRPRPRGRPPAPSP